MIELDELDDSCVRVGVLDRLRGRPRCCGARGGGGVCRASTCDFVGGGGLGTAHFAVVPGPLAFAGPRGRCGVGGGSGGLLFLAKAVERVRPTPGGALAFAYAARDCELPALL